MPWRKSRKTYSEKVVNEMYNAQVKKYENSNFIVATKKDRVATIKYFIESEENALEYNIQGLIYPQFHYEIKSIVCSKMASFTTTEITNAFFHMLRMGSWFKPHKGNFYLYQEALKKTLPYLKDSEYHVCALNRFGAYLILGVLDNNDMHKITLLTYDDFIMQRKFVLKYNNYSHYPGMRKKKLTFLPFLSNEVLMQRVKKAITLIQFHNYDFKFSIGASLILLLLDKNKTSKEILIKLHQQNLPNHFVWILGDFYKDFQDSPENKKLLTDLYTNYPNKWINEYQSEIKNYY